LSRRIWGICVSRWSRYPADIRRACTQVRPARTTAHSIKFGHLIRNTFRYASKADWDKMSRDLRPVYTAVSEHEARERFVECTGIWGERCPAVIRVWENTWAEFVPFLDYSPEIRRRSTVPWSPRSKQCWNTAGPWSLPELFRFTLPTRSPNCRSESADQLNLKGKTESRLRRLETIDTSRVDTLGPGVSVVVADPSHRPGPSDASRDPPSGTTHR
jgi:hypothetical protein